MAEYLQSQWTEARIWFIEVIWIILYLKQEHKQNYIYSLSASNVSENKISVSAAWI